MIFRFACCLTALAAFVASPARAADTAKDILQKAVEAHGGKEALLKHPAGRMEYKGNIQLMGAEVEFTGKSSYHSPRRERNEMSMEIMGQKITVVQIANGDKVKMSAAGMDLPISDAMKEEIRENSILMEVYTIAPLLVPENKYELRALENTPKVGGKETVGVAVFKKGLKETKLYFDKKSNLMVKLERQGVDPNEKEGNQEMFFTDYKKVQGMLWPHKFEVHQDGKKFLEMEVSSFDLLDKIDAKEFDVSD